MRPYAPLGPSGSQPLETRGTIETLYSHTGVSPIEFIRDPAHVKLKGTGWTMAHRVFHPSDVWPAKDANEFMAKNLILKDFEKALLDKITLKFLLLLWD